MIKLARTEKPEDLTADLQILLTEEFKVNGRAVWNLPFIKAALMQISQKKCCYCEANISEESKYLEVEHYFPKSIYPELVIEWSNLLPACKRCNGKKGNHDPAIEPIINPFDDDPKNHLVYSNYRFRAPGQVGKNTISILELNNQDRLIQNRFNIGDAVCERLEEIFEMFVDYRDGVIITARHRNRIVNGLRALMKQGLPSESYAATTATMILNNEDFLSLVSGLSELGIWDSEFENIAKSLSQIALPTKS